MLCSSKPAVGCGGVRIGGNVGTIVGSGVGAALGSDEGAPDGKGEGSELGRGVGGGVGNAVGNSVGCGVGAGHSSMGSAKFTATRASKPPYPTASMHVQSFEGSGLGAFNPVSRRTNCL